jgi:uncharacterized protein (TIGR00266 family)
MQQLYVMAVFARIVPLSRRLRRLLNRLSRENLIATRTNGEGVENMKTNVEFAPSYSMLTVELDCGEAIKAEAGAMVAQMNVELSTGMGGSGLFGGIRRMVGGESFFVNTFTAENGTGWVSLSPSTPGDIGDFQLQAKEPLFIQSNSFLACTPDVKIDAKFQGLRGLFSGEGMFFLKAESQQGGGTVFYNSYGAIKEVSLMPGQELVVDTGHVVAFTENVDYSVGKVGGIRSLIAGGEGLVMNFSGRGSVWVQTHNIETLAHRIIPFIPSSSS